MIVGVTGHRPDKLGGYSDEVRYRLFQLAVAVFKRYQPAAVISGLALGWDTEVATAAVHVGVPLIAAIPFEGQELKWRPEDRKLYHQLIDLSAEVHYVCSPGYAAWKMQKRNEWIVDHCDLLFALWDGNKSGTGNCVEYAQSKGVDVKNLWQSWVRFSGVMNQGVEVGR